MLKPMAPSPTKPARILACYPVLTKHLVRPVRPRSDTIERKRGGTKSPPRRAVKTTSVSSRESRRRTRRLLRARQCLRVMSRLRLRNRLRLGDRLRLDRLVGVEIRHAAAEFLYVLAGLH